MACSCVNALAMFFVSLGARAPLLPTDFGWDHRLAILLAIFQSLIRWSFTSCDLVFRTRSSFSSAFGREKRVGGEVSAVGGPPATSTSTYLSIWLSSYPTIRLSLKCLSCLVLCLFVSIFFVSFPWLGIFICCRARRVTLTGLSQRSSSAIWFP